MRDQIIEALTEEQTVALTAWAEARSRLEPGRGWISNPLDAMADIVNVIMNRAAAKKMSPKAVCLAKAQFSCWAPVQGAANHDELLRRAEALIREEQPTDKLLGCLALAAGALNPGRPMVDTLDGATHYYAPQSMVPAGRVPAWAAPPAVCVATRYGHKFYKKVKW